jgi:hypothetical protein
VRTIPIDISKLTTVIGGDVKPATNQDGTVRTNREGKPLMNVPVIVMADGGTETMTVRIPGPVPSLPVLTRVVFVGLVAKPWSLDGRAGVSFQAESIQPAPAARS